jgi:nitric oxide synthase-interacting protein
MKDLTDVKWTKLPPSAAEDAASRWRYMCPVTRETLTDASRVVVLKPSGAAVSEEAYDKVLAREKEWDGRRIKGVVKLQRGGSGFAASGTQVESKKSFLVGAGSGLADSRGQHRGGASKFGLRFN